MLNIGTMRERLRILRLDYDAETDAYAWTEDRRAWAEASLDTKTNLFSAVGIGARNVTFTMRRDAKLNLHQAIAWAGQHCFLTAIQPHPESRGFLTVTAALCTPRSCQMDAGKSPAGSRFPGILTEKYVGHIQTDVHGEVTTDYVLVTPKEIQLAPGGWVTVDGAYYKVLVPHLLDAYKNEFEIRRKEDC